MSKAATRKGVAKGQKPIAKKKNQAKGIKPTPDPKVAKSVPQARKEQRLARTTRLAAKKCEAAGKDTNPPTKSELEKRWNLNLQQLRFCDEYLVDLSVRGAYLRAGFKTTNKNSTDAAASRLLGTVKCQAYIAHLMKEREARTHITQDRVLHELALIGFLDIGKAFDDSGNLMSLTAMPEDIRRAIGGMEIDNITVGETTIGTTSKVKIIEKTKALELLGRHLKMFTDKAEISNPPGEAFKTEQVPPNYAKLDAKLAKHAPRPTR
jgi:phage terminase small subunit